MKEKIPAVPKELVRRGLDDGTERLRRQFRDVAQGGRSGEDYGSDRIEDTAADVPRRIVCGTERAIRQIQRSRTESQTREPPPESLSDTPVDVSDSKVAVPNVQPAVSQSQRSDPAPDVSVREHVAHHTTAKHPSVKEKGEQIAVSEKPAVTTRVTTDGLFIKAKEPPAASVPPDIPPSWQYPQMEPKPPSNIAPDVGNSKAVVQAVQQTAPQHRVNVQTPPVESREPSVSQRVRTQVLDIKTHEQVSDIKTRPDAAQIPIRSKENAAEQLQFSEDSPSLKKSMRPMRTVTPPERRCVVPSTSKDVPPYPRQTVQKTVMCPAKPKPAQVKECRTFSNIHPKIKGKQSAIQSADRSVRKKIKIAACSERDCGQDC